MPAVRTPEASQNARQWRLLGFCLPPSGTRSATPTTIDFGAIFPFTAVPAYKLPVYASQWPLPNTTQDSVRGCWLSFAAAAIPGGWVTCAFKAQPAQIRTSPIRAYGLYGAFFVKGASRHFCLPFTFFCSTCAASILSSRPHICIAVARSGGQGRRFFSAAEGLSLTDASAAAGC